MDWESNKLNWINLSTTSHMVSNMHLDEITNETNNLVV